MQRVLEVRDTFLLFAWYSSMFTLLVLSSYTVSYSSVSLSVMFDSLQPHGLQPTRLLCPWNSPGKNTGVRCHSLLQEDLPNPRIESRSPALQADSLPTEPLGKHHYSSKTGIIATSSMKTFFDLLYSPLTNCLLPLHYHHKLPLPLFCNYFIKIFYCSCFHLSFL